VYEYKARVVRIVDADTFDVLVDLGFDLSFKIRIRINDYDAPEIWRPRNQSEAEHGDKATAQANKLVWQKDITIRTYKLGIYGRYTADVILPDGRSYSTLMKELGFEKSENY